MLSVGKNIKQKNDPLQKADVERVYRGIVNPKAEIVDLIEHLRILRTIDPKSYRKVKTNLPYVVAALFNPHFRRLENFNSIQHFIIDLDHLSDYDFDVADVKQKLKEDEIVNLMFISPGGDGLKIFFKLKEPCFDYHKFSLFYKSFANHFSKKYNFNNVIDFSTSDVTRACFVSYDKDAYYNATPEEITMDKFVDFDDIFVVKKLDKELKMVKKETEKIEKKEPLDKDVFIEIKKKLNPNIAIREERKKTYYVPPKLNEIVDELKEFVLKFNLKIDEIRNINYGKKFIFSYLHHSAELNVFYGKKGFSVVRSPKSGTNIELMELGYKVFCEFFEQYEKL